MKKQQDSGLGSHSDEENAVKFDTTEPPLKRLKLPIEISDNDSDSTINEANRVDEGEKENVAKNSSETHVPEHDHIQLYSKPYSGPPEEATFAIDHLIEAIFLNLDPPTLFTCRSVCHRFDYFASKELHKVVTLRWDQIYKPPKKEKNRKRIGSTKKQTLSPENFNFVRVKYFPMETFSDPNQPLHELSTLLKNSINFPCSSFVFRDVEGSTLNLEPQFFLNTHGSLLKKLELDSFGCSILLEDLRRLLLVQAPNLEHFVLAVSVVYSKKKRRVKRPANYDSDSYTSPSSDSSPDASEYEESQDEMTPHQKDGKSARGQNTPISLIEPADRSTKLNLKVLEIGRNIRISQRILREILEASPKLTQVKIVHNEYLHLLVKPVNRLHLLKELETRGQHRSIRSLEILAEHHQGNWALRKLNFEDTYCTDSVLPRMRTAMNKILAGCSKSKSKSLTKLHWGNLSEPNESLPELELPQMPHVQQLVLSHGHYSPDILFVTPKFFPSGIRLKTTFPNLKILRFSGLGKKTRLDQLLDEDDLEPVESVTKVVFDSMESKPNKFVDKDSFKAMFPNASFWYKEFPEWGKGFFYPIFE